MIPAVMFSVCAIDLRVWRRSTSGGRRRARVSRVLRGVMCCINYYTTNEQKFSLIKAVQVGLYSQNSEKAFELFH
jgi:hypothetical protein